MMKKEEIFEIEEHNFDRINLFLEGTFWKAYERSAFHFTKSVKAYKPSKKEIKYLKKEIASIGFPQTALNKITGHLESIERSDKKVVFIVPEITEQQAYSDWKSNLDATVPKTKQQPAPLDDNNQMTIIERIKNFDVSNVTPLECMNWITKLKQTV